MEKQDRANSIVKNHILWSIGGGLIPFPLADLAAVTALQVNMLEQLADLYDVDYSQSRGKTFVAALTGGSFAKIGASLFKLIPGVGTVAGAVAMSATSGASTYAVGKVSINHFESGGTFDNFDFDKAKEVYKQAFEEGKEVVAKMKKEQEEAEAKVKQETTDEPDEASASNGTSEEILQKLEKLGELKEKGILTEEEFEAQKQKLLDRL